MEIKIGNKKYELTETSIYISDLYLEYVRLTNEPLTLGPDMEELELEYTIKEEEADSTIEKKRVQLAFLRALKKMKREVFETTENAAKKRDEIIMEVVTLNGYEYDRETWTKSFSDNNFTDLVEELIANKKKEG